MSAPQTGQYDLRGYGLTPAQIALPADPFLIPDSHRWLFFDITAPHLKYGLNPATGAYVAVGGGSGAAVWGGISGTLSAQTDLGIALSSQGTDAQTGTTYTLVLADAGLNVDMNNAGANTLTIPLNATAAFPIGTVIGVTQAGAGVTTIAAAGGVTLVTPASRSLSISAQYETALLYKIATNTWRVYCN